GTASGENRVQQAIKNAVESPLLETSVKGAKAVLLNVMGGYDLGMLEFNDAADFIANEADPDAIIIIGTTVREDLADQIKVTVIATGFEENLGKYGVDQSLESVAKGMKEADEAKEAEERAAQEAAALEEAQKNVFSSGYNPENDFPIPSFLQDHELNLD
ncbi:MAG: cell division protein FtsZ, partial [Firmicutes bacterium]|nr:cell division protein FtsZ [Bacillota bacterium]